MASINLIEAFQEFKEAESIDRPTMMRVVEDVFKTLLRKKFGSDENFDVIVNAEKGDLETMFQSMRLLAAWAISFVLGRGISEPL